ncbi:MAG: M48 family metallopeptidase [Phycisphaerales bacterium]|nr:M48 family metallopeptidase [Phycisphaerales bacterium]|tara:strand:+ start:354631 stop:355596 length:966 start_codon:yes stop_codon:yes gene_type:complete
MNRTLKLLITLPLLLLITLPTIGCSVNPATGKRSFTLMSWEKEKALGLAAAPQMTEAFGGEVPDAAIGDYARQVGGKLVTGVEEGVPQLEWEFTVLNSPVINAFALPGGKIFLSRGLAEKLDSEAQFAGVLGHEIGHVTARHSNQQMSQQLGINFAIGAVAAGIGLSDADSDVRKYGQLGLPAVAVGSNLYLLSFGRSEELEADMLGMRYMSRAGYNPRGQLEVMQVLAAESQGARQPEWLSTHPLPESRIDRINELLATQYADTQNNPSYVDNQARYKADMLDRLSKLPPAPEPSADEQAQANAYLDPSLYCAECRHAVN